MSFNNEKGYKTGNFLIMVFMVWEFIVKPLMAQLSEQIYINALKKASSEKIP